MAMFWCTSLLFVLSVVTGIMAFGGHEPARSIAVMLFSGVVLLMLISAFFEFRKFKKVRRPK